MDLTDVAKSLRISVKLLRRLVASGDLERPGRGNLVGDSGGYVAYARERLAVLGRDSAWAAWAEACLPGGDSLARLAGGDSGA